MKKFSVILLLLSVICSVPAQTVPGQNKKGIPPFSIIQGNGVAFKAADLKKDLPLMIVYFDPDCDHCRQFTMELVKQLPAFGNVQIVFVTYVPVEGVKSFVSQTGLGKYPGIKVGTEGTNFIVRYHYNVMQFPYLALHDKTGNLFATFESEVPPPAQVAAMFR
jgi:hypothetical protein